MVRYIYILFLKKSFHGDFEMQLRDVIISGFYGRTDLDQLKIDMLVYNVDDIISPLFGGARATPEEKVSNHLKEFERFWHSLIKNIFFLHICWSY